MATRQGFPERKQKRKEEAATRQEAYDKLSHSDKVAKSMLGSKERLKLVNNPPKPQKMSDKEVDKFMKDNSGLMDDLGK
jgi:hypothetical protein